MELPIKVDLKRPITIGDETYATLSFDEPDIGAQIGFIELQETFRDAKASDDGSEPEPHPVDAMRATAFWISRLAGVPDAVGRKIKESDMPAVNAALSRIMDLSSAEGDGSSGNEEAA